MRVGHHTLATWSSTQKVVSLSSAETEHNSVVRCASEAIGLANTIRELGHEAHVLIWKDAAAARGLALRSGAIKHWRQSTFGCSRKKNQELRIEKIRGTVNPADMMTKHLDGERLVRLCDLPIIKHITGRPSSAPKQTMGTEYISRASQALAAMTLVRQAVADEVAVLSGAEYETRIDEHRINYWAMAGWITVVTMTCCILMGLVLLWCKSGRVAETIDSGTQTLEEGRCSQEIPTRIMVTARPRIAEKIAYSF